MSYKFKVWNQGHDGRTMGIRVEDVDEVAQDRGCPLLAPYDKEPIEVVYISHPNHDAIVVLS